jgi:hypothetical protein
VVSGSPVLLIESQLSRYPGMQIMDLYKFIYQGVMGSGHAVESAEAALKWLRNELLEVGTCLPGEITVEDLPPFGEIVKVNLRPYILCGGDPDVLLDAFIRGSTGDILKYWEIAACSETQFSIGAMNSFIEMQKDIGFPLIHHSMIYRELYRPAYRIVCKQFIEEASCLKRG